MNRISQLSFILVLGCCAASLSGCNKNESPGSQTIAQQPNAQIPATKPVGDLPSRSLDDLKNAVLVSYVNKDEALLQKLMYPDRVGQKERDDLLNTARENWMRPLEGVTDEPLAEGMGLDSVIEGQRYEGNLKPLGLIRVGFVVPRDQIGIQASGVLHPYGVKDGAYYLATAVRAN